MRYRIIIETQANGTKSYFVQKKFLFCWFYMREILDISMYRHRIIFDSIEKANLYIQSQIDFQINKAQSKIVKQEIIY